MSNDSNISDSTCSAYKCTNSTYATGLCKRHYDKSYRYKKNGNRISIQPKRLSFADRDAIKRRLMWNMEISKSGCWNWLLSSHNGYGLIRIDNKLYKVPRVSMHIFNGFDLSSKLEICHHCDNPPCFNPDHLFAGTRKDNMQDALRKGRLKPKKGRDSPLLKLTDRQVREIRALLKDGVPKAKIAKIFNISRTTVKCIGRREAYDFVG